MQLLQHLGERGTAITLHAEDDHAVTVAELDISRRAARCERAHRIGREHLDATVGQVLAPNQDVALIGVDLQCVQTPEQVREAHAFPPGIATGTKHMPLERNRALEFIEHPRNRDDVSR